MGPTEIRTIEETLNLGWRLVSMLPREELTRVSLAEIDAYYGRDHAAN
jgi:V/A-type H+-transporting ATPase subunit B